ncbi:TMEM165/GDT1 family protein [Leptolyngbya sp. NK1-12]|uniref:TMEM165/GDT1 family protein n=1 Tax=Leptolyngbya sp. NK1-12 TaxID=2547451 RepID=UPI00292ED16F|nr:TMEM165/GDT1 family protein [Leptolyngbya sp. NK1-12]
MEHSLISRTSTVTLEEALSPSSTELTAAEPILTEFTTSSSLDSDSADVSPANQSRWTKAEPSAELKIFCSTFLTIFLAELGDKTQMATLLMTAESHQPWIVFAGAGSALVATSLIGVWLGCWLAKRVSTKTLEKSAGLLLLLVAAQLVWDVFHL